MILNTKEGRKGKREKGKGLERLRKSIEVPQLPEQKKAD